MFPSFTSQTAQQHLFALALSVMVCFSMMTSCGSPPQESRSSDENKAAVLPDLPAPPVSNTTERRPLMISSDFGRSWQNAGQGLPDDLQASFLVKCGEELLLASDNLGLFKSTENRTQWQTINEGLPHLKINALYTHKDRIYVGVYRKGIYGRSKDGESWTNLNADLPDQRVQCIHQSKNRLFVGTDSGIFFKGMNADSWTASTLQAQTLSLYEKDDKLIAGTSLGTALSTDHGQTWEWIRQEGSVHYTLLNNNRLIELVLNGDLVYSDDWGNSWRTIYYGPNGDSYVYDVVETGDQHLLSNNYGIHLSQDKGETWDLVFPTETMAFFDLLVDGHQIYGSTRVWDEYRGR